MGSYYLGTRARTSWISNDNWQVLMWNKNYTILQPQPDEEFPSSGNLSSSVFLSTEEKRWGQIKYRMSGISLLVFSCFPSEMVQILKLKGSNKIYRFFAFGDKDLPKEESEDTLLQNQDEYSGCRFIVTPATWRPDPLWWPALPASLTIAMAAPQSYLPSHEHKQKVRKESQSISHLFNFLLSFFFLDFCFPKIKTKRSKNHASGLLHLRKFTLYYFNR